MEFETFKDNLESYIYENMDLGDKLADKLNDITEGSWDNRTYHYQPDFVALNVKGKGMGDYSKVSDILSEDDYIAELGRSIQYFFNDWEQIFREDFGLTLGVMGRSGGWWGFKADDLTDFKYVLQLNEDKVKELYSKMDAESIDEYTDFYELFDTDDSDDFFEGDFFDFTEDFAVMVNNFVNDIKATSDHFEGDEYNNEFRTIYESAPTSSKNRLKESEEDEDDGWSEEILDEVEGVISDIEQLAYELRSCVRGAYTNCKTREELSDYITHLAEDLMDAAERI